MTTPVPVINVSAIKDEFGAGGANLVPTQGIPNLRDILRNLLGRSYAPVSSTAGLTASLAADRVDGMQAVNLADYTTWTWEASSAAATSADVIAPTDVGAGVGRWVHQDVTDEAAGGAVIHDVVDIPLATLQAQTSGTAFNLGAVLPANARLIGLDLNVIAALAGTGPMTQAHATVQGGTDAAGSLIGSTDVFSATGIFATAGSNPYKNRGGQAIEDDGDDSRRHARRGDCGSSLGRSVLHDRRLISCADARAPRKPTSRSRRPGAFLFIVIGSIACETSGMPKKKTPISMLVRLKPYDVRRRHVLRVFTHVPTGSKFTEEHGWYTVDEDLAAYLKGVHQAPNDDTTPLAFDVCTKDEAIAIHKREAAAKLRADPMAAHDLRTEELHTKDAASLRRAPEDAREPPRGKHTPDPLPRALRKGQDVPADDGKVDPFEGASNAVETADDDEAVEEDPAVVKAKLAVDRARSKAKKKVERQAAAAR